MCFHDWSWILKIVSWVHVFDRFRMLDIVTYPKARYVLCGRPLLRIATAWAARPARSPPVRVACLGFCTCASAARLDSARLGSARQKASKLPVNWAVNLACPATATCFPGQPRQAVVPTAFVAWLCCSWERCIMLSSRCPPPPPHKKYTFSFELRWWSRKVFFLFSLFFVVENALSVESSQLVHALLI